MVLRAARATNHALRGVFSISRRGISLARAKESWNGRLVFDPEVEHALEKGNPVIALESTIITHGMPHPTNLTTAQSLESIIRSSSVVPATIALIDGKVHVGLSDAQLEQLADPAYTGAGKVKASRRDIAGALSKRLVGGTTVASTMYVAQSVGVDVFVTGGIGGAHRGSQDSLDISADLIELGRTPMAVVCAGAKSILDIPRTLEVLETQGVCVASYGDTHDFPAFYSPSSGQKSPWNVANPTEAASLIHAGLTLPHPLATLLAVPIPTEYAARGEMVQQAVEQAVRESIEQGIDKRGKEVTPWLLKRVGELTGGTALELNVKLIENNARVGAAVALELARLKRQGQDASGTAYYSAAPSGAPASDATPRAAPEAALGLHDQNNLRATATASAALAKAGAKEKGAQPGRVLDHPRIIVFGSAALDITSRTPHTLAPRSTTPGEIELTPGGVGRNIAEAAQKGMAPNNVMLVSALAAIPATRPLTSADTTAADQRDGNVTAHAECLDLGSAQAAGQGSSPVHVDPVGEMIISQMEAVGLRQDGLIRKHADTLGDGDPRKAEGLRSSSCTLVLGKNGDLEAGVADMGIVETISPQDVHKILADSGSRANFVIFDCNMTPETIGAVMRKTREVNIPTFCDPTSTPKLHRLIPGLRPLLSPNPQHSRPLSFISPNTLELGVLHDLLCNAEPELFPTKTDPSERWLVERNQADSWTYLNTLGLGADFRARVDAFIRSAADTTPSPSASSTEAKARSVNIEWLQTEGIIQQSLALLPWFSNLYIKAGKRGVVRVGVMPSSEARHAGVDPEGKWRRMVYPLSTEHGRTPGDKVLVIAHYAPPDIREDEIVSTTGAGDSFVGGLVAGMLNNDANEQESVKAALERVEASLRSRRAVA